MMQDTTFYGTQWAHDTMIIMLMISGSGGWRGEGMYPFLDVLLSAVQLSSAAGPVTMFWNGGQLTRGQLAEEGCTRPSLCSDDPPYSAISKMSAAASPAPSLSRSSSRPTYTPPSTSRRTPNRIPNPPYSISSYLWESPPEPGRDIQQIIYRQKEASAERKRNMAIKMHSPMKSYLDKIRQDLLERIEYEVMQSEDPKSREFIASSYNTAPTDIYSSTPPRSMMSSSRSTPIAQLSASTPSAVMVPDSKAPHPSPFPIISLDSNTMQNSDHQNAYSAKEIVPASSFCTITLCICTLAAVYLMLSPVTHQYLRATKFIPSDMYIRLSTTSLHLQSASPSSDPLASPLNYEHSIPRDPTLTYEYYANFDFRKSYPIARKKRRLSDIFSIPMKIVKRIFSIIFGSRRQSANFWNYAFPRER